MGKKSFVVYADWQQHLTMLDDAEKGRLFMAIFDYKATGEVPSLTGAAGMAFSFIRAQLDRDDEKYEARCRANRENGAKGGRPPKEN